MKELRTNHWLRLGLVYYYNRLGLEAYLAKQTFDLWARPM